MSIAKWCTTKQWIFHIWGTPVGTRVVVLFCVSAEVYVLKGRLPSSLRDAMTSWWDDNAHCEWRFNSPILPN